MLINQTQLADPVAAIQSLKEKVYDHDRFTLEEYLGNLPQTLWKFQSIGISIEGETLEEKCQSCLEQLIKHGMVRISQ